MKEYQQPARREIRIQKVATGFLVTAGSLTEHHEYHALSDNAQVLNWVNVWLDSLQPCEPIPSTGMAETPRELDLEAQRDAWAEATLDAMEMQPQIHPDAAGMYGTWRYSQKQELLKIAEAMSDKDKFAELIDSGAIRVVPEPKHDPFPADALGRPLLAKNVKES